MLRDGIVNPRYGIASSAAAIGSPLLCRLHAEWCAAAVVAGGLPDATFINPLQLSYLLGHLLVVGVERTGSDGGLRFHYRLIGTELVARRGRDHTGEWMDQHEDPVVAETGTLTCRLAVESGQPVHLRAERRLEGRHYPLEYLLLPLADQAVPKSITRLLIAQLYPDTTPRLPYRGKQPP